MRTRTLPAPRRVVRPNYDKQHRCPAWSGPAWRTSPDDGVCPGGYITFDYDDPRWRWKPHQCAACGTVVLPDVVRLLDPNWWRKVACRALSDWKYERTWRRK